MSRFHTVAYLLTFITFLVLLTQAFVMTDGDEEKKYDLDFVYELINAPVVTVVLTLLINSSALPVLVLTSLFFTKNRALKQNLLV